MFSTHVVWRGHGDFFRFKVTGLGVNSGSHVVASICEGGDSGFIGDATMYVKNIAPQPDGSCDFILAILWDYDLTFRLTIGVLD